MTIPVPERKAHTPRWKRSSPELRVQFERAIKVYDKATLKTMFGYSAAFLNGNLFSGLFGESWYVRLLTDDRQELLTQRGAHPFEPTQARPMPDYVVLPPAMLKRPSTVGRWLAKAVSYAATLPPIKPANRFRSMRAMRVITHS